MKVKIIFKKHTKKHSPWTRRSWSLDLQGFRSVAAWPPASPQPGRIRAKPGAWHLPNLLSPLIPGLWLLSHPARWTCLTSVFHSTLYLAFLSPGLGQLGKTFGPELGTISEEFSSANCLLLYWVRVGGFDSCRERCSVLGWDGWWTHHKSPVCLGHKSEGCTSSEARKLKRWSQVNRPESTGRRSSSCGPAMPSLGLGCQGLRWLAS